MRTPSKPRSFTAAYHRTGCQQERVAPRVVYLKVGTPVGSGAEKVMTTAETLLPNVRKLRQKKLVLLTITTLLVARNISHTGVAWSLMSTLAVTSGKALQHARPDRSSNVIRNISTNGWVVSKASGLCRSPPVCATFLPLGQGDSIIDRTCSAADLVVRSGVDLRRPTKSLTTSHHDIACRIACWQLVH